MNNILSALAATALTLAIVILAISLTPTTVIVAMILATVSGMAAMPVLFAEDDTTPAVAPNYVAA